MDTANMMRVNARSGGYAGQGGAPHDRQQIRRQKILALFEAVESGNLEAAKIAFKVLINFDRSLLSDSAFARLSQTLEAGSVYVAQQIVRDMKIKLVNAHPIAPRTNTSSAANRPAVSDGLHVIDLRA
jgi:hypothetical protein